MRQPNLRLSLFCAFLFGCFTSGCGGGGGVSTTPPPPNPTFTSVPPTAADEGAEYTYPLAATSPDGSAVTFSLASAPTGASLSAGTISWTPAHDQSRIPNPFSATATTAKGGSATQTWTITPSGVVNLTAVLTYWNESGAVNQPRVFLADQPYPAALVPQSDASLSRLQGSMNSDGSFSIPHVSAGYYWLQLSPAENFWTSSSAFDAGQNIVGDPITGAAAKATTTFDFTISDADPIQIGDVFSVSSNVRNLPFAPFLPGVPGNTSISAGAIINSNIDLSKINTLFFNQYEPVASGSFNGLALGPSVAQSHVTITNGAVNSISATLSPSPSTSIPLGINGSAWGANFQNSAPAAATPLFTDFFVAAQPFVQNAVASPQPSTTGPNLTLLSSSRTGFSGGAIPLNLCSLPSGPNSNIAVLAPPPIVIDQDFGTVSYGDPYPSTWLREFELCQYATVQIPRPNSTTTDEFRLGAGLITALPSAPVSPLVGPIQSPTLNGSSIFQPATLNTATLNLSWAPPIGSQPFGYYISIYLLGTLPGGASGYIPAFKLGTAKTSATLPFLTAGNTYILVISAQVDAGANMESAPYRTKLPVAYSTVVSAPITINPGATPN